MSATSENKDSHKLIFDFQSKPITAPLQQMSFLRRSLLLAELAWIAYLDEDSAASTVAPIGLDETLFVEEDGAQAYVFRNAHDCIVACRGTEPTDFNDVRADLNAIAVVSETVGRVHSGFKKEVDDLWPQLEKELAANDKTLWFTGHSLGGAMATICAGRCQLSNIPSCPQELFTFGSPRVGDRQYANYAKLNHYRWVNNNDIVTRLPPVWMRYRHSGRVMYLNYRGELRKLSSTQRARDRWRGVISSLRQGKIDYLVDHSMDSYIAGIVKAIAVEESGQSTKGMGLPTN